MNRRNMTLPSGPTAIGPIPENPGAGGTRLLTQCTGSELAAASPPPHAKLGHRLGRRRSTGFLRQYRCRDRVSGAVPITRPSGCCSAWSRLVAALGGVPVGAKVLPWYIVGNAPDHETQRTVMSAVVIHSPAHWRLS